MSKVGEISSFELWRKVYDPTDVESSMDGGASGGTSHASVHGWPSRVHQVQYITSDASHDPTEESISINSAELRVDCIFMYWLMQIIHDFARRFMNCWIRIWTNTVYSWTKIVCTATRRPWVWTIPQTEAINHLLFFSRYVILPIDDEDVLVRSIWISHPGVNTHASEVSSTPPAFISNEWFWGRLGHHEPGWSLIIVITRFKPRPS